jgi:hypothetical protein
MEQKLDVGGVISKVWRIYVDQAPVLMPAAAVVFALSGIAAQLLAESSAGGALLAFLIRIVASTLFTGMVVELVADVQDGRRDSSAGQLLRAVTPVLWQLIAVAIIAGIVIVIGLIALVVPGLYLITIWSVFVPVIVLERAPGLSSLSRSRALVRGNGWQVFAVLFVLFILVGVLTVAAGAAAASASTAVGLVVQVVLGILTAPLAALAAAVLYFELDGRRPRPGAVAGTDARPDDVPGDGPGEGAPPDVPGEGDTPAGGPGGGPNPFGED